MPQIQEAGSVWAKRLSDYRTPNAIRAGIELAVTALPFLGFCFILLWSVTNGALWLYLIFLPVAAGFVVRLFMIQHDCGHQSFFSSKRANDWTGRCIGVVTLTAYNHWRRAHAAHHATSGNLDKRGFGDIDTITVAEYQARTKWTRLRYRIYRSPPILFLIGPIFIFIVQNRIPAGFFRGGWRPWVSTLGTDLAIVALWSALMYSVGAGKFLLVFLPIIMLAAIFGAWLFYIQHQFPTTHWRWSKQWNSRDASLLGSSHYDLPQPLRWLTANIGVHHVHHLSSRIPSYRLGRVLRDHPELQKVSRVTLAQSLRYITLSLWDEDTQRLISFRDLKRRMAAPLAT